MRVLFADSTHPFLWDGLVTAGFDCIKLEDVAQLESLIAEIDGIVIRSRFKISASVLDNAPKLKFIARVGAGMENIDVDYATSKGIYCLHAPEGNRNAVAEHALGMLLALMNNIVKADAEVRRGIWLREQNRGTELCGKTVGIIGYGNTGSTLAKRLRGFDVNVLAYDKYVQGFGDAFVKECELVEIFGKADVLSIHLPLTEETKYLVNRDFLQKFKKPIYLINTARGKCVNTADLVEMIEKGKVLGACIDVLEFEAVSFESVEEMPAAFQALVNSGKVILTPHIAGWTHESNYKMASILVQKILVHTGNEHLVHKIINSAVQN